MEKILITGATGYIGSHIIKDLAIKKKYKLTAFVLKKDFTKYHKSFFNKYSIGYIFGNLFDINSIKEAIKDNDTIIHLAGGGKFDMNKKELLKLNYIGSKNLLESCTTQRIIFVSSTGVINPNNRFLDNYSFSKMKAEELVKSYMDKLNISIIRPALVYGAPLTNKFSPSGVVPFYDLILLIIKKKFFLPTKSNNLIHSVFINNLVHGFKCVLKNGKAGKTYNIADKDAKTLHGITKIIVSETKSKIPKKLAFGLILILSYIYIIKKKIERKTPNPVLNSQFIKAYSSSRKYNLEEINKIGYKPKYDFEKGMRKTIRDYKYLGLLDK